MENAQEETTLRPPLRRRCAMGEPSLLSAIAVVTEQRYIYIYIYKERDTYLCIMDGYKHLHIGSFSLYFIVLSVACLCLSSAHYTLLT